MILARAPVCWLADRTPTRDNNIKLLRHVAALCVVLFHSMALSGHIGDEPLWRRVPQTDLGLLGVQIFFVLSGFLVTQSWLARPHLRSFVAARVLRIYPALVVATLFTIALAGCSSTLRWEDYLASPATRAYLWRTATAVGVTELLPGAFSANPWPHAANGSLWTLPIELRLYGCVAIAGIAGVLARRWVFFAALGLSIALCAAWPLIAEASGHMRVVRGLVLLFALGSAAFVWRVHVPLSIGVVAACIGIYAWNPGEYARGVLALPMLVYVVLAFAYHPRLRCRLGAFERAGDYSYGIYVYAFPIQQTIAMRVPDIGPWALFAATVVAAGAAAAMSWHFVEAPALRQKSRFVKPASGL